MKKKTNRQRVAYESDTKAKKKCVKQKKLILNGGKKWRANKVNIIIIRIITMDN